MFKAFKCVLMNYFYINTYKLYVIGVEGLSVPWGNRDFCKPYSSPRRKMPR